MRANYSHLKPFLDQLPPGDFIEVGVWQGATFLPLAKEAARQNRLCVAVDSFAGMAAPTKNDFAPDGSCRYPQGALYSNYGQFRALVAPLPNVRTYQGYVPSVLSQVAPGPYVFGHIDLDQYLPTLQALRWLWPRLVPGGVALCHDYFPGRTYLASAGVDAFCREAGVVVTEILPSNHAVLRKT